MVWSCGRICGPLQHMVLSLFVQKVFFSPVLNNPSQHCVVLHSLSLSTGVWQTTSCQDSSCFLFVNQKMISGTENVLLNAFCLHRKFGAKSSPLENWRRMIWAMVSPYYLVRVFVRLYFDDLPHLWWLSTVISPHPKLPSDWEDLVYDLDAQSPLLISSFVSALSRGDSETMFWFASPSSLTCKQVRCVDALWRIDRRQTLFLVLAFGVKRNRVDFS